ncbi:SAM-dependent methyltransferase [Desulfoferula mesophila]|uniref:Cobalt-precorrin-4 C(11)-methyltransferase n=1 Tax=Desulfoferula mesophila TaxID=3058419 RepID=A0AAU9EJ13_9BACT|nr:cobalt-precorrin-4 C(11)-methyltransferase [Desulfoferula mesophilus]
MSTLLGNRRRPKGEADAPAGSPNFNHGFFYLIGCGPGGPQTATLQALETIQRMDAILAPARQARMFAEFIGDIPIAFDPWAGFWDYQGRQVNSLSPEEAALFRQERDRLVEKRLGQIRDLLERGMDVGLLEFGNPCLFGPGQSYAELLKPQEVIVIPGMGADAAAMAALQASILPAHDARFLLQAAPFVLTGQGLKPDMSLDEPSPEAQELLTLLGKQEHSAIFYMALTDAPRLFEILRGHLPGDLPCAVVFWAGDLERQRVLRGTLDSMPGQLADDPERFMGLLLVGRFLEGKPFSAAHQRSPAMSQSAGEQN